MNVNTAHSLFACDVWSFVKVLSQLGFIGEGANRVSLKRALSLMIERYCGMTLGEVSEQVIAEMVEDVKQLLYGQALHIPAQFAFTGLEWQPIAHHQVIVVQQL